MKRVWGIVGILVVATGGYLIYRSITRRPRIDIESVDWTRKTVTYEMKAGGAMKAGIANLGSAGSTGGGGYALSVKTEGNALVFTITKDGVKLQKRVDFTTKQVT